MAQQSWNGSKNLSSSLPLPISGFGATGITADVSFLGVGLASKLDVDTLRRGRPATIVFDNGTERTSRAILFGTQKRGVH